LADLGWGPLNPLGSKHMLAYTSLGTGLSTLRFCLAVHIPVRGRVDVMGITNLEGLGLRF
jgi:hypothetical protein